MTLKPIERCHTILTDPDFIIALLTVTISFIISSLPHSLSDTHFPTFSLFFSPFSLPLSHYISLSLSPYLSISPFLSLSLSLSLSPSLTHTHSLSLSHFSDDDSHVADGPSCVFTSRKWTRSSQ